MVKTWGHPFPLLPLAVFTKIDIGDLLGGKPLRSKLFIHFSTVDNIGFPTEMAFVFSYSRTITGPY